MKRTSSILVAAALALISTGLMAADGPNPAAAPQATDEVYQPVFTDGTTQPAYQPQFLGRGATSAVSDPIVRFGWWGTQNAGAPTKTGEWQGLGSSPFFDVDGLSSNGERTFNYFVTGMENESTQAGLNFFGPLLDADIDYQRYLRRLDHDPLADFRDTNAEASPYIGNVTDLNAGEDYAIRVQEFDARFKGHITDNIKWRLNVWGMRKQGERQADAFSHSCSGGTRPCHIGSQRQRIDWMTTEIEPVIETHVGPVSVEYSRTMRVFEESDQRVASDAFDFDSPGNRFYNGPSRFNPLDGAYPYAAVADNYTQIDRIKIGVDVTENTDLYALLYYGDTENRNRGTHRTFNGWDFRLTNHSIDGVTLAAYGKGHSENNQLPTTFPEAGVFALNADGISRDIAETRHPVDRDFIKAGVKGRWELGQRRYSSAGWALSGGYEYSETERAFVTFSNDYRGQFTQPNSYGHLLYFGPEWRVSSSLDTYFRYKMFNTRNPLYGFRENQEELGVVDPANDTAVNTNQPQHVDTIEFGGTWTPTDNFLLSASIGIEKNTHYSSYADFDEDNYPIYFSAWWAPTEKLSLTAGLGFYSNYITQDITIGTDRSLSDAAVTTPWFYGGRADVYTLGANYACTDRLTLTGGMEFVRGVNRFADPSSPGLDLMYLPDASAVLVETWRFSAGVDYLCGPRTSVYFRYVYYDYQDETASYNTGTSNFFLGGFSAVF